MALNLLDTYPIKTITADFKMMHFDSYENGKAVELRVIISNEVHFLIPGVYNLAFGPPKANTDTEIDDKALIRHDDLDKMMSTILLFACTYSKSYPTHLLGIDGSNDIRAIMYFRKIKANITMLKGFFSLIAGTKYYVRFRRFSKPDVHLGEEETISEFHNKIKESLDLRDIVPLGEPIVPETQVDVYNNFNYFIFKPIAQLQN